MRSTFDNEICSERIFGVTRSLTRSEIWDERYLAGHPRDRVFPAERFDRLNVRDVEGEGASVSRGIFPRVFRAKIHFEKLLGACGR